MNANECLRKIALRAKTSKTALKKMGYTNRSNFYASVRPGKANARSDRLVRILDALGYDLVARSRDGRAEYVIDE